MSTSSSCTRPTARRPSSRRADCAEAGLLEAEVSDPGHARARVREETGCARRAASSRAGSLTPDALASLAPPLERFFARIPPLAERVAQAIVGERDHEHAVVTKAPTLALVRVRGDPARDTNVRSNGQHLVRHLRNLVRTLMLVPCPANRVWANEGL